MSLTQNQTHVIGGTQFTINALGASVFPTLFSSGSNCMGGVIQAVSGSTTFIMPNQKSGANIAGATAVLSGWPIPTSSPWAWEGPANFYVATASATAVIAAQLFYGTGATLA